MRNPKQRVITVISPHGWADVRTKGNKLSEVLGMYIVSWFMAQSKYHTADIFTVLGAISIQASVKV